VSTRRALELTPAGHPFRATATQQLERCRELQGLDAKLTAVLEGKAKPATPNEQLALASVARQPHRRLYAASARFYGEAFTADPRLGEDPRPIPSLSRRLFRGAGKLRPGI